MIILLTAVISAIITILIVLILPKWTSILFGYHLMISGVIWILKKNFLMGITENPLQTVLFNIFSFIYILFCNWITIAVVFIICYFYGMKISKGKSLLTEIIAKYK